MRVLGLSQATAALRRVFFMLVDVATWEVPQTGKAGTLAGYVTKLGAGPNALAGSFAEVDNTNMQGLYYYEANAGELDTLGRLVFEFTCAACLTRTIVTHVGTTSEALSGELNAVGTVVDAVNARLPSDPADQSQVEAAITAAEGSIRGGSDTLDTLSGQLDVAQVDLTFLKNMEGGRWKIDDVANQMIFYKADNVSEVARFDLKDVDGNPSSDDPFERTRV